MGRNFAMSQGANSSNSSDFRYSGLGIKDTPSNSEVTNISTFTLLDAQEQSPNFRNLVLPSLDALYSCDTDSPYFCWHSADKHGVDSYLAAGILLKGMFNHTLCARVQPRYSDTGDAIVPNLLMYTSNVVGESYMPLSYYLFLLSQARNMRDVYQSRIQSCEIPHDFFLDSVFLHAFYGREKMLTKSGYAVDAICSETRFGAVTLRNAVDEVLLPKYTVEKGFSPGEYLNIVAALKTRGLIDVEFREPLLNVPTTTRAQAVFANSISYLPNPSVEDMFSGGFTREDIYSFTGDLVTAYMHRSPVFNGKVPDNYWMPQDMQEVESWYYRHPDYALE